MTEATLTTHKSTAAADLMYVDFRVQVSQQDFKDCNGDPFNFKTAYAEWGADIYEEDTDDDGEISFRHFVVPITDMRGLARACWFISDLEGIDQSEDPDDRQIKIWVQLGSIVEPSKTVTLLDL